MGKPGAFPALFVDCSLPDLLPSGLLLSLLGVPCQPDDAWSVGLIRNGSPYNTLHSVMMISTDGGYCESAFPLQRPFFLLCYTILILYSWAELPPALSRQVVENLGVRLPRVARMASMVAWKKGLLLASGALVVFMAQVAADLDFPQARTMVEYAGKKRTVEDVGRS